jgi:hypothetical protein
MTREATVTDDQVIADLEFSPICNIRERWTFLGYTVSKRTRCTNLASWIALFPCCGLTIFVCEEHRVWPREFPHCRQPWYGYHLTWKRI